ncbi:hypothetical protein CesoFtcFv8_025130 [Champsocephalus esox]|uniref:Uncharacterized protein n=1 Tax=Champsocephalus esox TaxID=159716 RepID=A0AAN8GG77_9TELE|nr:hypothetical protein CesoFtcFv8_025130 [Champsocephalus esox]
MKRPIQLQKVTVQSDTKPASSNPLQPMKSAPFYFKPIKHKPLLTSRPISADSTFHSPVSDQSGARPPAQRIGGMDKIHKVQTSETERARTTAEYRCLLADTDC